MPYYNNYPNTVYNTGVTSTPNYPQLPTYPYNQTQNAGYYSQMPVKAQNIIWVQGRAGAEAYQLEPGSRAVLLDSQSQTFYIKEVSWDGRPLPLMTFKYEAVDFGNQNAPTLPVAETADMSKYATKDDFNELKEMLEKMTKSNEEKHGKPALR